MYDLIIAGAGPAGSAAGLAAAAGGLNTLILEKDAFPRYKACGGAISENAASSLGFPIPTEICEGTITGARVHFRDRVIERHSASPLVTLVTRSNFDNILLQKAEKAGCHLAIEKVMGYKDRTDHISVVTKNCEYQARFLIVSTGCQDMIKNRIQGPWPKENMGVCMVTEVDEDDSLIPKRLDSSLDIYFGVANMGYGWIFPHRGYYSVGIGGLASRLTNPRKILIEFLKANGFSDGQKLHGHFIPQGGNDRRIALGRVLLTGDAAGFVDPFTGEGIYYALRSGQIAAQVIQEASITDVAKTYQHRVKKDFGEDLKYALFFSKIMHSHPNIFLRLMACHEEILDRYMEIAASKRSYKEFISWLLPRLPFSLLGSI